MKGTTKGFIIGLVVGLVAYHLYSARMGSGS